MANHHSPLPPHAARRSTTSPARPPRTCNGWCGGIWPALRRETCGDTRASSSCKHGGAVAWVERGQTSCGSMARCVWSLFQTRPPVPRYHALKRTPRPSGNSRREPTPKLVHQRGLAASRRPIHQQPRCFELALPFPTPTAATAASLMCVRVCGSTVRP